MTLSVLKFEKKGHGRQILTIRKLTVSPYPIRLNRGSIKLSLVAEIHEDVPADIRIYYKAWKVKHLPFGLKIHIPAPNLLPQGCTLEDLNLQMLARSGLVLKADTYKLNSITIPIPTIEGFVGAVVRWLLSGKFLIEVKIIKKNGEQLSCYSVTGEAKS
ncbi:uncharacterized protein LOC129969270 [Argiope bruennichi]|uniref:Uncharacterized protein n=1 Tax=Argiope bruennichi TaxID=94029 RepID=A0A8T0FTG3_ARGBR|nr:uncharacterized protein LOC129969270 [Argiope bruennichi]KAF8792810.1 hypothetical protein HNY73_004365 [Argiope bruennichi]